VDVEEPLGLLFSQVQQLRTAPAFEVGDEISLLLRKLGEDVGLRQKPDHARDVVGT